MKSKQVVLAGISDYLVGILCDSVPLRLDLLFSASCYLVLVALLSELRLLRFFSVSELKLEGLFTIASPSQVFLLNLSRYCSKPRIGAQERCSHIAPQRAATPSEGMGGLSDILSEAEVNAAEGSPSETSRFLCGRAWRNGWGLRSHIKGNIHYALLRFPIKF